MTETQAKPEISQADLLAAEKAGANSRAVQVIYRLTLQENNPHPPGDPRHDAYHRGYEIERVMRGG